ncbi:MAG: cobalt ECF transporter T component CbiQ [Spirochaetes bacterium RBG_13_51_14]|nr:MAG: cobalt ECF transporter T component CbiQ [Spirochaetes bacterium RBG_13_51_14]
MNFIDASLKKIAEVIKNAYVHWETAERNGFMQRLDPRLKVLFLLYCAVIISLIKKLPAQGAVAVFLLILILLSRLDAWRLYRRIAIFAFLFGFLVALPSAFNIITPGRIILHVASLSRAYRFWIYEIPQQIGITAEGSFGVAMLFLRVANSLTAALLIIHTTPFFEIIRALKVFRVPDVFIMTIILSYKYIFIFSRSVEDMYLAMKSRLAVPINRSAARDLVAGRIFFVFKKSWLRYEDTCRAMTARGFTGEIMLYHFRNFSAADAAAGVLFILAGAFFLLLQVMI